MMADSVFPQALLIIKVDQMQAFYDFLKAVNAFFVKSNINKMLCKSCHPFCVCLAACVHSVFSVK